MTPLGKTVFYGLCLVFFLKLVRLVLNTDMLRLLTAMLLFRHWKEHPPLDVSEEAAERAEMKRSLAKHASRFFSIRRKHRQGGSATNCKAASQSSCHKLAEVKSASTGSLAVLHRSSHYILPPIKEEAQLVMSD